MSYTQVPYKKASCKKAPCKKVPYKKASYKIGMLTALTIALSACGGSGSETVDNALNDANDSYKNIATEVRAIIGMVNIVIRSVSILANNYLTIKTAVMSTIP